MSDTGHQAAELRLAAKQCSELAKQLQANRDMLSEMANELFALAERMVVKEGSAS
jgi:hypothetical protein